MAFGGAARPAFFRMEERMEKKKHEVAKVGFRGQEFDIDKTAFASLKVQTALNLGDKDPRAANEAMNLICCGRVVEYIGRIPDEGGALPDELGCSAEDWQAFTAAIGEAVAAKN